MADPAAASAPSTGVSVKHLRQVLLWPLRLMPKPGPSGASHRTPWQVLRDLGGASPWREVVDEFTGDRASFHERHYNEFVTFLPCVQRLFYGDTAPRASRRTGPSCSSRWSATTPTSRARCAFARSGTTACR